MTAITICWNWMAIVIAFTVSSSADEQVWPRLRLDWSARRRRTRREQDPRPHCDVRALAHIAVYSRGSPVVIVAPFAERLRWCRAPQPRPDNRQ